MANNKIIYGGEVLIDLTADTVAKNNVLSGYTFHDKSGEILEGECTYDSNTQDATATTSEILKGKTAYVRGTKITGDMTNNGAVTGTISTKAGKYTIPQGYHDGSGSVEISTTEQAKLIPTNIREGITILGVEGTMSGQEAVNAQSIEVTPSKVQQEIVPQDGYNFLSSVTVKAIPYVESENSAGGTTVTIG